jgi:cytidylate kinase
MYATKRSRSGVYGSQKKQVVKTLSRTLNWTKLMAGTTNKSMAAMCGI